MVLLMARAHRILWTLRLDSASPRTCLHNMVSLLRCVRTCTCPSGRKRRPIARAGALPVSPLHHLDRAFLLHAGLVPHGSGARQRCKTYADQRCLSAGRIVAAPRVYWHTHEPNHTAILLYDKIADPSGFVVYRKLLCVHNAFPDQR